MCSREARWGRTRKAVRESVLMAQRSRYVMAVLLLGALLVSKPGGSSVAASPRVAGVESLGHPTANADKQQATASYTGLGLAGMSASRGRRGKDTIPGQYIVHVSSSSSSSSPSSPSAAKGSQRGAKEALIAELEEIHKTTEGIHAEKTGVVTTVFRRVLDGFVVTGVSDSMAEYLMKHDSVQYLEADGMAYKSASCDIPEWGLDRIDQRLLPLDDSYSPLENGSFVDIYILDTGLDTNHDEFANTDRVVQNVYNAYGSIKPNGNNDGDGHGTHVGGTAAGLTVGVSPGANLWGVKVLSDTGSGAYSTIVDGLEEVLDLADDRSSHRAVASMSLGGGCDEYLCEDVPSIATAVEALTDAGVVVSVAAGNNDDDACYYSPASVPSAITVGASDQLDDLASFSNYGACVDIVAPGVSTCSACTDGYDDGSTSCSGTSDYVSFSGTSMACPHVSGAVAQYFNVDDTLTVDEVLQSLQCQGVENQVDMDSEASPNSRNVLLQVPNDTVSSNDLCEVGAGCTSSCSSNGWCDTSSGSADCICDLYVSGSVCQFALEGKSNCISGDASTEQINITLSSTTGTGWGQSFVSVYNSSGAEEFQLYFVGSGSELTFRMCVRQGESYTFVPQDTSEIATSAGWNVCGRNGSLITQTGTLEIANDGSCSWACGSNEAQVPFYYDPNWGNTDDDYGYLVMVTNETVADHASDDNDDAGTAANRGEVHVLLHSGAYEQYECVPNGCHSIERESCAEKGITIDCVNGSADLHCDDAEYELCVTDGANNVCSANREANQDDVDDEAVVLTEDGRIAVQQTSGHFTRMVNTSSLIDFDIGDEQVVSLTLADDIAFAGKEWSKIYATSNGVVSFSALASNDMHCCQGQLALHLEGAYSMAVFWTDLDQSAGGNFYIGYTSENEVAVVYEDIPLYEEDERVTVECVIQPNRVIVRIPYARTTRFPITSAGGMRADSDDITVWGPGKSLALAGMQWNYTVDESSGSSLFLSSHGTSAASRLLWPLVSALSTLLLTRLVSP